MRIKLNQYGFLIKPSIFLIPENRFEEDILENLFSKKDIKIMACLCPCESDDGQLRRGLIIEEEPTNKET